MSGPVDPALVANGREVALYCGRQLQGVVEYDHGIPVVFRRRCHNQECCPRREGHIAIHRWTLYGVQNGKAVGEAVKEYVPTRPIEDLLTIAR